MHTNLLLKYTRKVVSQHVLNIATYDVICSNYRIVSLLFLGWFTPPKDEG